MSGRPQNMSVRRTSHARRRTRPEPREYTRRRTATWLTHRTRVERSMKSYTSSAELLRLRWIAAHPPFSRARRAVPHLARPRSDAANDAVNIKDTQVGTREHTVQVQYRIGLLRRCAGNTYAKMAMTNYSIQSPVASLRPSPEARLSTPVCRIRRRVGCRDAFVARGTQGDGDGAPRLKSMRRDPTM